MCAREQTTPFCPRTRERHCSQVSPRCRRHVPNVPRRSRSTPPRNLNGSGLLSTHRVEYGSKVCSTMRWRPPLLLGDQVPRTGCRKDGSPRLPGRTRRVGQGSKVCSTMRRFLLPSLGLSGQLCLQIGRLGKPKSSKNTKGKHRMDGSVMRERDCKT